MPRLRAVVTEGIVTALPFLSLAGLTGFVVVAILGFEEPHTGMLVTFSLLAASAPVGLAMHLRMTSELTTGEKRLWIAALRRRGSPWIFAAYFSSRERRLTTDRLKEEGGRG